MPTRLRNNKHSTIALAIAVGCILIAIVAVVFFIRYQRHQQELRFAEEQEMRLQQEISAALSELTVTVDEELGENSGQIIAGRNGLRVSTQETGTAVIIDLVVLDAPGFVLLYDDATFDSSENRLNNSPMLQRGVSRIVSIAAPERLSRNKSYYLSVAHDDGDGVFNEEDDRMLTDEAGAVAFAEFRAE